MFNHRVIAISTTQRIGFNSKNQAALFLAGDDKSRIEDLVPKISRAIEDGHKFEGFYWRNR